MSEENLTRRAISAFESGDLATILTTMSELLPDLSALGVVHPHTHPAMMLLAHRVKSICVPTFEFTLPRVRRMADVAALEGVSYVASRF